MKKKRKVFENNVFERDFPSYLWLRLTDVTCDALNGTLDINYLYGWRLIGLFEVVAFRQGAEEYSWLPTP